MKLTVAGRMAGLTGIALLGLATLTLVGHYEMEKIYDGANFGNVNAVPSLVVLDELRRNYQRVSIQLNRRAHTFDGAGVANAENALGDARASVAHTIKKYETDGCLGTNCFADAQDQADLEKDKLAWDAFDAKIDPILVEIQKGKQNLEVVNNMLDATNASSEKLFNLITEHIDYNVLAATKYTEEAVVIKRRALYVSLSICAVLLAAIGGIGLITTRGILLQLGGEPDAAAGFATRLAKGDLSSKIRLRPNDTSSVMAGIKTLIDALERLANRAEAIGKGNLDEKVDLLSEHDRLGLAINEMIDLLRNSKSEDERRNWQKDGLSQVSTALTGDLSVEQVADIAVGLIGRYLDAGRGVFYVYGEESRQLELIGSYMHTKRNDIGARFALGEGAVGQVARERKPIILAVTNDDVAPIVTGTVSATPRYTYTFPLLHEKELAGVIEFASFREFGERKLEFLESVTATLASFFFVAKQRVHIHNLLEASETSEKELRVQSEKLRESNALMEEQQQQLQQQSEELQQSNAQMEEQQQQLQQQSEELQQTNAQMTEQQKLLEKNNQELRASQTSIDEKAKQLELSNKYKSEFLANMSHELRTPLNAIILLSKMMADNHDGHLVETEIKRAEVIHRSGEDLLHLINDVLDLSKVDAGRMDLNFIGISSATMIAGLQDLFGSIAQSRSLDFIVEDRLQGEFISDPDKLSQILRNLLSNAFKFTKTGSVSLIIERLSSAQLPIRIKVRDSGIGIPQSKLGTIFEAFRQVDGSTSREYGGTGLGLTISLRFAELLGGTIEIHSTEGKGSEFSVHLPEVPPGVAAPETKASPQTTNLTHSAHSKTHKTDAQAVIDDHKSLQAGDNIILLIDDDIEFCRAVVEINHRLNYKTVVAHNGAEGLILARRHRPVGILLDLGLPDMDGVDLLHDIKASLDLATIPIFVISARERDQALGRQGIVGYIQKPVNSSQIAEAESLLLAAVANEPEAGILVVTNSVTGSADVLSLLQSKFTSDGRVVRLALAGTELQTALDDRKWGAVIVNLAEMSVEEGLVVAKTVRARKADAALLFHGIDHLDDGQEASLRAYTDNIIVNAPKSEQRLLENTERFLRSVHKGEGGTTEQITAKSKISALPKKPSWWSMTIRAISS